MRLGQNFSLGAAENVARQALEDFMASLGHLASSSTKCAGAALPARSCAGVFCSACLFGFGAGGLGDLAVLCGAPPDFRGSESTDC